MQDAFLDLEPLLRWRLYVGAFAALALWETFGPRKKLVASTPRRWFGNVALAAGTQFLFSWLVPLGAVITAIVARRTELGLLNHSPVPIAAQAAMGILALDLTRYLQHRLFHAVGPLWRLHQIHHSDVDMDITTGLRHHPLEAVVSAATYFPVVWLLGAPPIAVAAYELFLVFHDLFSHANIRMPPVVEAAARWLIVTPDMHRVHHSDIAAESQRNYASALPLWDRLFGTYQAQPKGGHEAMGLGINGFQDGCALNVVRVLGWPFHDRAMGRDKAQGQREN